MEYQKYDNGNGNELLLFTDKAEKDYNEMLCALRNDGYIEAQSSAIDFFRSTTLKRGGASVTVTFDERAGEIRRIYDGFSAELNTVYRKAGKCPVRMWQFEVDHTLIDCGMCYIFQLTDYSFFVIDSAHLYSVNDDRRLYEFLKKETPEGMPVVISGWYLSHGHVDHICKCLDFILNFSDIEIKGLYYNFVPNSHPSAEEWHCSDRRHTERFNAEVEKRTDIPKFKLHSGQYFYIDCLRVDVLCSHEDVFPQSLEDYNNSSIASIMTVDGDKISFPGDASGKESIILERRFPDFLKCDIMQVSHHGHFGTSTEFYRMSAAHTALFPVTEIKFNEEYPRIEANRVACEIAEHTYIAGHGTVMFTFPLRGSEILIYPDETNESFEGIFNLWGYDYTDEFKEKNIADYKSRNCYRRERY